MLTALIVYLVLIFLVAWYAGRTGPQSSLQTYYLGDRSMGGFLLAMTLTTTYASASSFIGGPGAAYRYGLGWVALAMIQLPVAWLSLGVLGKKLAILARRHQALTLNDILYARYGSRSLVWLASVSLLIALFAAMTVQFIGGARLLQTALGMPYWQGLLIFWLTVSLYTLLGGFRAVILTDALQGVIMLLGTGTLLAGVIKAAGGLQQAVLIVRQMDPQLLTPYGSQEKLTVPFMISFWVLICFGTLGLPHTVSRCLAYQSSRAMHLAMVLGTGVLGTLMLGMHLSGVLGRAVIPHLTVPDQIIPLLMLKVLSPLAAGIFLAAPLSAIMSTVDAQLLQSSATLVNDLYLRCCPQAIKRPTTLLRYSRLATLLLSLLLLLAAWRPPAMLIWLNLLAFGGLQVVFLWPLLLGLYWERANTTGALSAMITGITSYTFLSVIPLKVLQLEAIVPALLLSFIAFYSGNQWAQRRRSAKSH